MQFFLLTLFSLGIVALDQYTKFLTVAHIPLYTQVDVLPGIVGLTYVRNTGAAFSSFEGQMWLFILIFIVLTGCILWEYFKKPMGFTKLERWFIAAIYGGGLGNMIDRVRLGYVVDMIETRFMDFPVFNVADCFICCGCVLLLVHLLIWNKPFWQEEKKTAPAEAETAEEVTEEAAEEVAGETTEEVTEEVAEEPAIQEQKEENHDADCR